jgi:hypothetical protein
MPENETYDLDAAFARLEQDLSTLSRGPGAGRAVSTARRRRRTTVAAVAAVAIVAVGGVVAGHNLGRDHAVEPADRVPTPAPLTAEALTSATEGWTPAWEANTPAAQQRMQQNVATDGCFPSFSGGQADGYTVFGNSHDDLGITTTSEFTGDPSGEPVVLQRMVSQMEGCAQEVSSFDDASTGVAGYTFQIGATGSESAPEYVWIVSTGQGIGVLKILGQSDPLPSSNDTDVSNALLGAVEFRVQHSDPRTTAGRATPEQLTRFDPARLRDALGGWQSGWHDGQPPNTVLHLPCGTAAWNDAGVDTNIGADGRYWVHQFSSPTAAEAGFQRIQSALGRCPGYTTGTVTSPGGPSVFVARGQDDQWLVQHEDWVVLTFLPRAATPPPDSVSAAIGSAMVAVVDDALASYRRTNG